MIKQIRKERPPPRFGTVESINEENDTCQVLFIGEDAPNTVKMWGVRPTVAGQKVMVDGPASFRYISQVR